MGPLYTGGNIIVALKGVLLVHHVVFDPFESPRWIVVLAPSVTELLDMCFVDNDREGG
jgi:hypothetical protein